MRLRFPSNSCQSQKEDGIHQHSLRNFRSLSKPKQESEFWLRATKLANLLGAHLGTCIDELEISKVKEMLMNIFFKFFNYKYDSGRLCAWRIMCNCLSCSHTKRLDFDWNCLETWNSPPGLELKYWIIIINKQALRKTKCIDSFMSKPKPLTICKMTQSLMMKSHPITFTISPFCNKPFPVKKIFHVNPNKTFNMIRCRITLNNENTMH